MNTNPFYTNVDIVFKLPNGFVRPPFYDDIKCWLIETVFIKYDNESYEDKVKYLVQSLNLPYKLFSDILVYYAPPFVAPSNYNGYMCINPSYGFGNPSIIEYSSMVGMIEEIIDKLEYGENINVKYVIEFLTNWKRMREWLIEELPTFDIVPINNEIDKLEQELKQLQFDEPLEYEERCLIMEEGNIYVPNKGDFIRQKISDLVDEIRDYHLSSLYENETDYDIGEEMLPLENN